MIKRFDEYNNFDFSELFLEIDNFLESSKRRNETITTDYMSIYVRKSFRYINEKTIDFFDLATVNVNDEYRNKKLFTLFMSELLYKYPHLNIYVESILNPIVEKILLKYNFSYTDNTEEKNMYLIKDEDLVLNTIFNKMRGR